MKLHLAFAAASLGVLAACQSAPEPTGTVLDGLIGKRLVGEQATFIMNPDGTVGGNYGDEPIIGTYVATAEEVCSTYTSPAAFGDREYCSVPEINGNQVVFNRRDGSNSGVYIIQ